MLTYEPCLIPAQSNTPTSFTPQDMNGNPIRIAPYPATKYLEVSNTSVFRLRMKTITGTCWLKPRTTRYFDFSKANTAFDGQIEFFIDQQPVQFSYSYTNIIDEGVILFTSYQDKTELPLKEDYFGASTSHVVYAVRTAPITGASRSQQIYVGDAKELFWYVRCSSIDVGATVTFTVDQFTPNSEYVNLYTSPGLTTAPAFDNKSIGAGLELNKSFGGIVSVGWSVTPGGKNATMSPSLVAK